MIDKSCRAESPDISIGDKGWQVQLEGCDFANDQETNIAPDEFCEAFLEFVESKGWNFGGGMYQIDEDGEKV